MKRLSLTVRVSEKIVTLLRSERFKRRETEMQTCSPVV